MMSVADLRRAVFASNDKKLSDRNYTDLDVYPPGSSESDLSDRSRAARPRDSIASVLSRATTADDSLIVVARPMPASKVSARRIASRLRVVVVRSPPQLLTTVCLSFVTSSTVSSPISANNGIQQPQQQQQMDQLMREVQALRV